MFCTVALHDSGHVRLRSILQHRLLRPRVILGLGAIQCSESMSQNERFESLLAFASMFLPDLLHSFRG